MVQADHVSLGANWEQALRDALAGRALTAEAKGDLQSQLLADTRRAAAFDITPETCGDRLEQRLHLLQATYPTLDHQCRTQFGWQGCPLQPLWQLWLPLAEWLATQRRSHARPFIQGILGGQGTGKTTLTAVLSTLLNYQGFQVCGLSLDDLYKTYGDRQQLQRDDPRWRWRGPPGTHDIDLGMTVLQQLRQANRTEAIAIPRFDKSAYGGAGDRTQPDLIAGADIVLFEGWFVGVRPIAAAAFEHAPPPILTAGDRAFARDCNLRLRDYAPLWDCLDALIVLHPVDYRLSRQWRQHAEQHMRSTQGTGMSAAEVDQFVDYFWRSLHPELFITPLIHNPDRTDLVVEIQADHTPGAVYRP